MRNQYQMIVLDLDGTLTNSKKEITPRTKEVLMQLQEKGGKVVLASGRPTPGVVGLAKELHMEEYGGYVLSYNGARIMNYATGEIIYNRTVPQELVPDIYREASSLKASILGYSEDEIIVGNGSNEYCALESKINGIPLREVEDFVGTVNFPVNKFLLAGEPELMLSAQSHMRELFGWQLNIYRSEPFFLELMPQSIDKAYSLEKLLEHIGMDREHMICCGDGFNDKSMIHFAGLGVAMANAQPEVKEAADYITASNDEDGVAKVVERFML